MLTKAGPLPPTGKFVSRAVTDQGEPYPLVPGTAVVLHVSDGSLSARAGCNSISGPVRFETGRMTVAVSAKTFVYCLGEGQRQQDEWLERFLADRPSWTRDGEELLLTRGATFIRLGPAG